MFPERLFKQEEAAYDPLIDRYGIPLDDRHAYAKNDWSLMMASVLSEGFFTKMVSRIYDFIHTTTGRYPLTDFYDVRNFNRPTNGTFFQARPVIGAFWTKLLLDSDSASSTPMRVVAKPHQQAKHLRNTANK